MSFILDALRKSENERQQSEVPSISNVPAVGHNTRIPTWAVASIAALSASILLLGWAWWHSTAVGDVEVADIRSSGLQPQVAKTATMIIGPPTMMELIVAGTILPELALELHVYSPTASERFVRINSASYREGEVLTDGPRVLSITAEGVILDYRDQSFLLAAD